MKRYIAIAFLALLAFNMVGVESASAYGRKGNPPHPTRTGGAAGTR